MKNIFGVLAAVLLTLLVTACSESSTSAADQARAQNTAAQGDLMARATAAVPVPQITNFPSRQNLSKYMLRMDDPAKTWYVYVLGDNGAKLGFYVASSFPQSTCTFMTPLEETDWHWNSYGMSNAVTTAPGLAGVYHKGDCSSSFFFDAETDAMIILSGVNTWASDVPLDLDVPRIEVAAPAAPTSD